MNGKIYTTTGFRIYLTLTFLIVIFTGNAMAQWNIYDASVLPNNSVPTFGTSGLANAGMVSTIKTDPGNTENKLLELLTVANGDNGTWRRVYANPVNAITIVMRVKSANDDGRRVLELDMDNGGFRERLYINQEDNKLRLQHSEGFGANNEFSLPGEASVKDWNIYRITKDAEGNVKLYVNENATPLAEGKTATITSNNHFRFGDTNGSHNVSGLIDWIIWDKTGAYAPGEGTAVPSPVVTPSWDASLQEININGSPLNNFEPETLSYSETLPYGSAPPIVTANPSKTEAVIEITQATEIPGQATILVTAPNGYTTATYAINFEEAHHNWYIYDGSILPNEIVPAFGTSGIANAGMVSTIKTDPGNTENKLLELLTVANGDNGTWRRVYANPVNVITIVMRVKSANDDGRRVLELDMDNGGFRERLYINQEDNKLRLQHSEGFGPNNEFSLPGEVSVKDWNIYRITKDAEGNVKLYVNENTTPLAEGKTATITSNNHFRFGDTNGSHNVSGLIDWIIWDKTGVYAPGEGSGIPDTIVTPAWDATLSELLADGTALNDFAPDKYSYEIELPVGTTDIPQISASINHTGATIQITQADEIPGIATVEVTAENRFTVITYTIAITIEATGIQSYNLSGFRFFPNPANSHVTIELADENVNSLLEIISLTGQIILRKQLQSFSNSIDVSHLDKGTYILNLSYGTKKSSRLFIKN